MKTHKVFISHPMNGLSIDEILENQTKYEEILLDHLKTQDTQVIFLHHVFDHKALSPIQCFAKGVSVLAEADVVVLAGAWKKARGCILEYDIARAYGIETLTIIDENLYPYGAQIEIKCQS